MAFFLYIKPRDLVNAYNDSSPSVTGAVETGYNANWLVDGQPGRPTRVASADASYDVTIPGGRDVNFVGLTNHNIDNGKVITLGGDVSGSITSTGPLKNPYHFIDPTVENAGSVTLALTGNSQDVIIGEALIGFARELERPVKPGARRRFPTANEPRGGLYNSLTAYDYGVRPRTFECQTVLTRDGLDAVQLWYDETDDQTKFSVIVLDPSVNEFWCVLFKNWEYTRRGPDIFDAFMTFEEKRLKW